MKTLEELVMNEEKRLSYTRKVNLVVIIVCWTVITFYLISNRLTGMVFFRLLEVTFLAGVLTFVPTLFFLRNYSPFLVKRLFCITFTVFLYYNLLRAEHWGNFRALFLFFIALILVGLYMDGRLLLIFSSLVTISQLGLFLLFPQIYYPVDPMSFFQFMVGLLGSTLFLYFLTQWGDEMLKNSEECWRYALQGSGDGVWDWNLQDGVIFHSHSLVHLLGRGDTAAGEWRVDDLGRYRKNHADPEALIAQEVNEWQQEIHPEDRDGVMATFYQHLRGETSSFEAEYRRRSGAGDYRFIHDRGRVILRHGNGTPLRIVGTSTDISRRKEDEERLRCYAREIAQAHEKINNDITKAQRLHQQFLPERLPAVPGYSFAAYYQPAAGLGGDFYNVLYRIYQLGERMIFYLADVSGHGLDGALLNIFLRETINSFLLTHQREEVSPGNILRYVAEKYNQEPFPHDYFICLVVGILDLKEKSLITSGTGFQIPPLLLNPRGTFQDMAFGGLPISRALDLELLRYTEEEVLLPPQSLCLFTTDGIVEEDREGEIYGLSRLKRVLTENQSLPAVKIMEAINRNFSSFTGDLQGRDDITFLLIKVEEE